MGVQPREAIRRQTDSRTSQELDCTLVSRPASQNDRAQQQGLNGTSSAPQNDDVPQLRQEVEETATFAPQNGADIEFGGTAAALQNGGPEVSASEQSQSRGEVEPECMSEKRVRTEGFWSSKMLSRKGTHTEIVDKPGPETRSKGKKRSVKVDSGNARDVEELSTNHGSPGEGPGTAAFSGYRVSPRASIKHTSKDKMETNRTSIKTRTNETKSKGTPDDEDGSNSSSSEESMEAAFSAAPVRMNDGGRKNMGGQTDRCLPRVVDSQGGPQRPVDRASPGASIRKPSVTFSDDEIFDRERPGVKQEGKQKRKSFDDGTSVIKGEVRKENNQEALTSTKRTWCHRLIILLFLPVAAAVSFTVWKKYESKSIVVKENQILKAFLSRYEPLESIFPGQVPELWKRSRVALQKHLNTTNPSQPAILMFVAARNTGGTLRCLSRMVADSYSSSGSTQFDGADKQEVNSDKVKLDIDTKLSSGFERGKKAAVVHHFQQLPPSSTLIFYKFCDHENAAYKNVLILLTVLLEEEEELDMKIGFRDLEEKVWTFLQARVFASKGPTGHDTMDMDKLSGLWSRIAHVVLPVNPVDKFEKEDCE